MDELGAYTVLAKPVMMDELTKVVGRYFTNISNKAKPPVVNLAESRTGHPFALDTQLEKVTMKLWGTRGSTPTPGARYMRHGGQTSCFEIRTNSEVLIFDAGSGIRELGLDLLDTGLKDIHLFITHTHWDHIQGFPFFKPAYIPGFNITIYGAEGFGKDLESVFRGQLDRDYFPVQMEDMRASRQFKILDSKPIDIGGLKIQWEYSHHPGATVGYKIDTGEKKIGWFPDNEFLQGYVGSPFELDENYDNLVQIHESLINFLGDVDILIHEAQYPVEEYTSKIGWGHSSVSNACLLVKLINVSRWIITHHDDQFLENKLNQTRLLLRKMGHSVDVSNGYDGMTEFL